jgi:hypothetical protein
MFGGLLYINVFFNFGQSIHWNLLRKRRTRPRSTEEVACRLLTFGVRIFKGENDMRFKRHMAEFFRMRDPGGKPIAERRGRHRPTESQGSETGDIIPPGYEDRDNVGQTIPKYELEKLDDKPGETPAH